MEASGKTTLVVEATISAPVEKVWAYWTAPEHITQWNQASDDWHCPSASNDLRVGGSFSSKMAARDGSFEFDFEGIYDEVELHKKITYTLGDDRQVSVAFTADGDSTHVVEAFEAENIHSHEMQVAGWQAILNNFKNYTETN